MRHARKPAHPFYAAPGRDRDFRAGRGAGPLGADSDGGAGVAAADRDGGLNTFDGTEYGNAAVDSSSLLLQPQILVDMGPKIAATGADLRWVGLQTGQASRATSSIGDVPNGGPSDVWYPPEAPVSDRGLNTWFWHPNNSVMSAADLQSVYFTSAGMNTVLVLNVPPDAAGQLDAPDVELLGQFGSWLRALYAVNRLQGQPAAADTTWAAPGFEAAKAGDGDLCTSELSVY